jgi:hypothetical protein
LEVNSISLWPLPSFISESFISENILGGKGGKMVTFKVDADARAKVQGSEDQERYPIVAKVKGTGKDGGLSVQVSGEGSAPISAKIAGDTQSPIAIAPLTVTLSITPEPLKDAAQALNIDTMFGALMKLTEGLKVDVFNSGAPLSIALGKIPVDLTISVYSPAQETVFKVEIKGTVGEK